MDARKHSNRMKTIDKKHIKDCPFCGSNKKSPEVYAGRVKCPDCETEFTFKVSTITETLARWNERSDEQLLIDARSKVLLTLVETQVK